MHRANLTIITIPILLLAVATVAISLIVSEDAFARERYSGDSTSQAAAVSNECLNPIFDSNNIDNAVGVGNCGGTISQQDESGQASAPITHQSASPTIELQRNTGGGAPQSSRPSTCTECFTTNALAFDMNAFLTFISDFVDPSPRDGFSTIEQFCMFMEGLTRDEKDELIGNIEFVMKIEMGVTPIIADDITDCLERIFGIR